MAVNRNGNKTNNSTIISFEEFEYAVMQKILEEDTWVNRILREQYKKAQVASRDFTGVGFYTDFHLPENIVKVTEPVEYAYGDLSCDLNGLLCGLPIVLEGPGKINIRKNLEKVGLKGIIYDQFIVNDGGTRAILKYTQLLFANLPQDTIKEILKSLDACKTEKFIVRGQDFLTRSV